MTEMKYNTKENHNIIMNNKKPEGSRNIANSRI